MLSKIQILGLGAVAVDDLIYLESYPPANSKAHVLDRDRQCGGLTATALVAAARLGCRCAYGGITGTDEASDFALAALDEAGIYTGVAGRRVDRTVYRSTIIVDRAGNRTLLSDGRHVESVNEDWPTDDLIRSTRVLFVDHTAMPGMLRAARIARSFNIPVVADVERGESEHFSEFIALIDHLIVPEDLARNVTGLGRPEEAAVALWDRNRQTVVVTCGHNGSWYVGPDAELGHQEAYRVRVADTTGCGDVFHGAYAAGLVMALDLRSRLRLASAAAALKATKKGGQAGCPTLPEVERLIRSNSAESPV